MRSLWGRKVRGPEGKNSKYLFHWEGGEGHQKSFRGKSGRSAVKERSSISVFSPISGEKEGAPTSREEEERSEEGGK